MTTRTHILPLVFASLVFAAVGCNDKETGDTGQECKGPSANAGPDQSVLLGGTVTLDGGASVACPDTKLVYTWSFSTVPVGSAISEAVLPDNNSETARSASFNPDTIGTYVLNLVVSDTENTSTADFVVVDVTTNNLPPVADCGDALSALVGERVMLDGTDSYDPESQPLTYAWILSSAPEGSSLRPNDIYNPSAVEATLIPDMAGIFVTSLVVSDGLSWSEPAFCSVTVTSDNQIPIADAGDGGTLPPCAASQITLNGWGSYDPEGEPLGYIWSLVSAPAGSATTDESFVDPTVANAIFNWDVAGTYTFQLQVFDGEIWSVPDVVTYFINPRTAGTPPIANAGDDQTVSASAACVNSAYAWTCADCAAATLSLDGSASYDADGDSFSYYWREATGSVSLLSPYSVFTDAVTPTVAATYRSTTTTSWTVTLQTSDCGGSSDDSMVITYNCTGVR
jgi:hypothetical protein